MAGPALLHGERERATLSPDQRIDQCWCPRAFGGPSIGLQDLAFTRRDSSVMTPWGCTEKLDPAFLKQVIDLRSGSFPSGSMKLQAWGATFCR